MQLHKNDSSDLSQNIKGAEILLPTADLNADLAFFMNTLGFSMTMIYPADNPRVSVLSGYGLTIRLEQGISLPPPTLRILCENPDSLTDGLTDLIAPNGVRVEVQEANPPLEIPQTKHSFLVRRLKDNAPWVIGRAGMQYRDLVPGRLGGSIIASHIRIPNAGPVPDVVHYHTVGFQLIFAYRGEVRLVYEDQGPPFLLKAGDCLIQPPEIRHRVLESSNNLQVIEIGGPAEHVTTIDDKMELPTPKINSDRIFSGQKFCRNQVKDAKWEPWRIDGFEARNTGILEATDGIASVQIARAKEGNSHQTTSHTGDILFTFVMEGSLTLDGGEEGVYHLEAGDAYVIPPHKKTTFTNYSENLELLEVAVPGSFETINH